MTLRNPTDDKLNAAFAEKVAGYYVKEEFPGTDFPFTAWQGDRHLSHHRWASEKGPLEHITQFIASADAVLPWLDKYLWQAYHHQNGFGFTVNVHDHRCQGQQLGKSSNEGMTFPRAAVIALLRAHGVEVVFT